MGLFSRPKLPANLSSFEPKEHLDAPVVTTIPMPKLQGNFSCTFLTGPMNGHKGDEIINWLGKEFRHKSEWTPEEIIWSAAQSFDINGVYFPDRELVPLDKYTLYQARLKIYPYEEVSEIVKAAKVSLRKGNPLEFVYSSRRNFLSNSWQEPSVHTVIVQTMDEHGFVGYTRLGPRRFSWQRIDGAALLEGDVLAGEKAIRFEFIHVEGKPSAWELSELDEYSKSLDSRLVITLGEHRGKGVFSYGYPLHGFHDVEFGNS